MPIVEPDAMQNDKRKGKGKNLFWKEVKICLAHAKGSKSPSYGGTLQGDVDTAGAKLLECANSATRVTKASPRMALQSAGVSSLFTEPHRLSSTWPRASDRRRSRGPDAQPPLRTARQ